MAVEEHPLEESVLIQSIKDRLYLMEAHATAIAQEGQEKSIHQFRVNARRLHSYTRFAYQSTSDEWFDRFSLWIRKVTRPSNKLRDMDVAMEDLQEMCEMSTGGLDFYEYLKKKRKKRSQSLQNKMAKILKKKGFRTFEKGIKDYVSIPDSVLVDQGVEGANRLKKKIMRFNNLPNRKTIHDVRLEVKRYRYFLELMNGEKSQIGVFKKVQNYIGVIHDCEIQLHLLLSWAKKRWQIPKKIRQQIEEDTLSGFFSEEFIQMYLAKIASSEFKDNVLQISHYILIRRDTVYKEFLQYWDHGNVMLTHSSKFAAGKIE